MYISEYFTNGIFKRSSLTHWDKKLVLLTLLEQ